MIKTKIIETTEKYDKDGKLVEKITREETSEDKTNYAFSIPELPKGGELPFADTIPCNCGGGAHHECNCKGDEDTRFEFEDDGTIHITAENVFINQDC